jgi:flotillin
VENLSDSIFIIMAVILGVVFAFFMLFRVISNYYIKVPPNFVAVVYGRKNKADNGNSNGYELVTGGSKFILPLIESVEFLELSVMSLEINISNIPNKDGVLVSVQGNANVKILSDLASLAAACERFLGKAPTEIQTIAHRSLEGHLRAIIGKLTIEDIIGDRSKFNQKVLEEAGEDLRKLGLGVDFITIQDITDNEGYLAAIGQKKIAEVKRDGQIGRAEAERETKVRTTTATMEGEKQSAENAAKIAEAEKERDVKKAQYRAETEKEQAKSEQARPLASAQAKKEVIERESEVAIANSEKIANELLSTVVKPAEAQKQADIINAEADKSVTINQAEAQKQKTELEAQGKAAAILAEGQASAKVIQMKLEAEAAGTIKKAEAYKMMDDVGRQMQMIDKIGEVGPGILDGVAKVVGEAAKPLGNVKEIKILDMNGGKNGSSAVANFAQMVPAMLLQMNETMKSAGYDISGLLGKANIKETVTDVGVDQVLKDMLKDLTPEQRELFKNVTPEQIELMKKVFKKSNTEEMKK